MGCQEKNNCTPIRCCVDLSLDVSLDVSFPPNQVCGGGILCVVLSGFDLGDTHGELEPG